MTFNRPVIDALSSGGVVYRRTTDGICFVLCGKLRDNSWHLPKGTPEPGESLQQTALREVREETGLEVEIEGDLGYIEYNFVRESREWHKRVYFFLMVPVGGDTKQHDAEFDLVEWASPNQGRDMLTYADETQVLLRAVDTLGKRDDQRE